MIVIVWLGKFKEFFNHVYPLYPWDRVTAIPSIAIFSFIAGFLSLMCFYSYWLVLTAIISFLVAYLKLGNIYQELWKPICEEAIKRARELDKENLTSSDK